MMHGITQNITDCSKPMVEAVQLYNKRPASQMALPAIPVIEVYGIGSPESACQGIYVLCAHALMNMGRHD